MKLEEKSFYAIHMEELLWTRTVANSPFVPDTENFCLDSIKSRKSSEPPVQAAHTFKFWTTSIFLGPVACPCGLVIYA